MEPCAFPLVALLAHPDDEIFVAGLLAEAARKGAGVFVVCATRGERGPRPAGCTDAQLASIRSRELTAACEALGAPEPAWLELPDGALADVERDGVAAAASAAIAPLSPGTLVSFGPDGGYGHRDHIAIAAAARDAADRLRPRPRLLAAAFPRALFSPICRDLRRLSPSPIDPHIDPDALGIDRSAADLVVDVKALAPIKRAVAAAHRSQLPSGDPDHFLAPGLLSSLLREEWYTEVSTMRPPG